MEVVTLCVSNDLQTCLSQCKCIAESHFGPSGIMSRTPEIEVPLFGRNGNWLQSPGHLLGGWCWPAYHEMIKPWIVSFSSHWLLSLLWPVSCLLSLVSVSTLRYLQEVGYTDTILDVKSQRVRALLGLTGDSGEKPSEKKVEPMVNGTEPSSLKDSGMVRYEMRPYLF